ncbi:hypothetical protein GOB93_19195 [Acetobacter musti]|uniref:Uncharacterized protein n=2 Tax=Acetobacter musti TaxID=864732 RepID=A0ABX0JTB3_9PROT|nr:hypothetical protein [Acetobacter musti]
MYFANWNRNRGLPETGSDRQARARRANASFRGCFKSLLVKSPLNHKEIFGEAFLKASEDTAFLGKGGTQKLLLFFLSKVCRGALFLRLAYMSG